MFGIGAQEMLVILVVALLVFGPKRLPELARTVGRGLAEFRRASTDMRQAFNLEEQPHRVERPPQPAQAGVDRPADLVDDRVDGAEGDGNDPALPPESHADAADPVHDPADDAEEGGLRPVPTDPRQAARPATQETAASIEATGEGPKGPADPRGAG